MTADGDVLSFAPQAPFDGVDRVRIETTALGDLFPAWKEIEILVE